jgi:hypothetical protein
MPVKRPWKELTLVIVALPDATEPVNTGALIAALQKPLELFV